MIDIQKKDNENQFEYIKRIVDGIFVSKTIPTSEYENLSELIFGEGNCYNSSEVRKRLYGIKHLLEVIEKNKIDNIDDLDILSELELKKIEIQKEKYKIQTEKIELNRWIREQARMELFEEKILDAINKRNKNIIIPTIKINNNKLDNEMILSLADQHYGSDFEVQGMFNEVINKYNPEIFEKRMWDILNKTVIYTEKNNFKKVHIFDLDDSIEGLLHISQLSTLRYGVTDSIIAYADFMGIWINELSKYICIDYSRVKGNHNDLRLLTGKKGDTPNENSSRIITHIIELILKNNPNVNVQGHNSIGCIYKKIADFDILVSHGQDEKGNLEKAFKDYMLAYKINIDYFYTGHLHSTMIKEIGINKEFIQTPSIMGINDFSMGIKKTANAGAKITILSRNEGRTDEHNIILK